MMHCSIHMRKGTPDSRNLFLLPDAPCFPFHGLVPYLVPVALFPFGIGLSSIIL